MKLTSPTPEDVSPAIKLLRPEKFLTAREDLADLDNELKVELHDRLHRTVFPTDWASCLQQTVELVGRASRPTNATRPGRRPARLLDFSH